jgi:uncharacterized membrane protein
VFLGVSFVMISSHLVEAAAYAAPLARAVFFAAFPFATKVCVGLAFDGFRLPFFSCWHFADFAFGVFFAVSDTS